MAPPSRACRPAMRLLASRHRDYRSVPAARNKAPAAAQPPARQLTAAAAVAAGDAHVVAALQGAASDQGRDREGDLQREADEVVEARRPHQAVERPGVEGVDEDRHTLRGGLGEEGQKAWVAQRLAQD